MRQVGGLYAEHGMGCDGHGLFGGARSVRSSVRDVSADTGEFPDEYPKSLI